MQRWVDERKEGAMNGQMDGKGGLRDDGRKKVEMR